MTQERLSVRTIREVLRLKYEIGLSNRAIARACRISNSTVGEYITRAKQAGWAWPLPEEVSEDDLYRRLFPEEEKPKGTDRPVPNLEIAVAGVPREASRWLWANPVSGTICTLESGTHYKATSAA